MSARGVTQLWFLQLFFLSTARIISAQEGYAYPRPDKPFAPGTPSTSSTVGPYPTTRLAVNVPGSPNGSGSPIDSVGPGGLDRANSPSASPDYSGKPGEYSSARPRTGYSGMRSGEVQQRGQQSTGGRYPGDGQGSPAGYPKERPVTPFLSPGGSDRTGSPRIPGASSTSGSLGSLGIPGISGNPQIPGGPGGPKISGIPMGLNNPRGTGNAGGLEGPKGPGSLGSSRAPGRSDVPTDRGGPTSPGGQRDYGTPSTGYFRERPSTPFPSPSRPASLGSSGGSRRPGEFSGPSSAGTSGSYGGSAGSGVSQDFGSQGRPEGGYGSAGQIGGPSTATNGPESFARPGNTYLGPASKSQGSGGQYPGGNIDAGTPGSAFLGLGKSYLAPSKTTGSGTASPQDAFGGYTRNGQRPGSELSFQRMPEGYPSNEQRPRGGTSSSVPFGGYTGNGQRPGGGSNLQGSSGGYSDISHRPGSNAVVQGPSGEHPRSDQRPVGGPRLQGPPSGYPSGSGGSFQGDQSGYPGNFGRFPESGKRPVGGVELLGQPSSGYPAGGQPAPRPNGVPGTQGQSNGYSPATQRPAGAPTFSGKSGVYLGNGKSSPGGSGVQGTAAVSPGGGSAQAESESPRIEQGDGFPFRGVSSGFPASPDGTYKGEGAFDAGDYSAIPGEPGRDYPIYADIPETSFQCEAQQFPGYYADVDARCQVFHICANNKTYDFLCPNGTIFHQQFFVCVWWNQFDCNSAANFYYLNEGLYDYTIGTGFLEQMMGVQGSGNLTGQPQESSADLSGSPLLGQSSAGPSPGSYLKRPTVGPRNKPGYSGIGQKELPASLPNSIRPGGPQSTLRPFDTYGPPRAPEETAEAPGYPRGSTFPASLFGSSADKPQSPKTPGNSSYPGSSGYFSSRPQESPDTRRIGITDGENRVQSGGRNGYPAVRPGRPTESSEAFKPGSSAGPAKPNREYLPPRSE